MTSNDYKEDLGYLYSALLLHPSIVTDVQKKTEFEALYCSKRNAAFEYDSFVDTATELTTFFQDGHTNIEIPYTSQDRCARLKCGWSETECDKLVLREGYEDIPEGALILAVEGMPVSELVNALADRIPHENLYLVKSRMVQYPYQNYHLFSEMNLKRLFGSKESYVVSLLLDGKFFDKEIPLTFYDGFVDFLPDEDFLDYEVCEDAMILHLRSCIYNERYRHTLREVANMCAEQQMSTFVLDLSENMGGDSSVIDEFIRYTRVHQYRRYEMVDYSSGTAKEVSNRNVVVENRQQEVLLPERIYCKVSHNTFSSARTFAVTLRDNGIAEIIGTPTGGKPNSFGMPKRLSLPNSNIRFRVSRCGFRRPDTSKDEEITVLPDME